LRVLLPDIEGAEPVGADLQLVVQMRSRDIGRVAWNVDHEGIVHARFGGGAGKLRRGDELAGDELGGFVAHSSKDRWAGAQADIERARARCDVSFAIPGV
jgi:hypothetical protein